MIKVLYGIQKELIDSYINNFIEKEKIKNIIKIDYEETNIDNVIEESSYIDLFGEKKIIILYNANFLTSKEKLDSKSFEKYLSSPNNNTILFLIVYNEKLYESKKFVKLLRKNYELLEFNKFSEYDAYKYLKESFKKDGYSIEEESIKKIVEYLSTNFGLYDNEIKKLKLYKYDEKAIYLEDVLNLTSKVAEDDIFKLLNAVMINDKEEIFKLYKDIKSIGIDEIYLIALLSSQFRFLYQVNSLMADGKTKMDIVSILESHPYKTELTMKKANNYKIEKVLDIMYALALIDIKIKTSEVDKEMLLEDFFLNL